MKFTLSWLKDHLDTKASLAEITDKLSAIGLEVEGVDDPGAKLGAFTIARVTDAKKHPNADKLQVVQVETEPGKPQLEVVCGAPNARAGMIAVFAPLGTVIPGSGITLEKRPVRGIVSNGMLVSERELELSEEHEGIIELAPEMAKNIGKRYVDVMGLGDPVIEVKLTPNRPDCTGVRGIARDLAAAGLGKLKPEPKLGEIESAYLAPCHQAGVQQGDRRRMPRVRGALLRSVKNGPSPAWMQTRLRAVGLRPINALVDVTNYISQDRGRPLHVYDAGKIKGGIQRGSASRAKSSSASTARSTRSTRPCASSPTTTAHWASAASSAAKPRARRTQPRTFSSRAPTSILCAPPRRAARPA